MATIAAKGNDFGYLSGAHSPVSDEIEGLTLEVSRGELPREIRGMFVRNSGNPQHAPPGNYHWFDGDGMVHGFHFEDGQVRYVNRWIRTRAFELEREAGEPLWGGLLDPLDVRNPHGPIKDTANTDLIWHNGKLLALWWLSGEPYEIEIPTLDTIGPCDFGGTFRGDDKSGPRGRMAAHAKVDPNTGEMMFFDFDVMRPPYYRYGVIGADGRLSHYEAIETPRPYVPHDIGIAPRHTVIMDLALGWDLAAMAQGKRRIMFDRSVPARFGVLPRHGTHADVRWFEAEPCYVYHTIRCYEDGDEIVLTACRVGNPCPDQLDTSGKVPHLAPIQLVPVLYEWRFNLATGHVKEGPLDDRPTEFPRINDAWQTRAARYSYNPHIAPHSALLFDGLVRYDLERDTSVHYRAGDGWFVGEPCFVGADDATAEDDGWLVTTATHAGQDASKLIVLRADDLEAGPIAELDLPRRIPMGFHAEWAGG